MKLAVDVVANYDLAFVCDIRFAQSQEVMMHEISS